MASHVEHAVRQYLPDLLKSPPVRPSASLQKGQTFQNLADSLQHTSASKPLTECQTRVQRMVGAMRYPEKVLPVLTLGLHRLSCVAQNPPPAASLVADLLLEVAFDHRFEGLMFGGSTVEVDSELQVVSAFGIEEANWPPHDLEAYGDATWTTGLQNSKFETPPLATIGAGGQEVASRDLYSVVLTFRGAAILHQTKKLALLVDCCRSCTKRDGVGKEEFSNRKVCGSSLSRLETSANALLSQLFLLFTVIFCHEVPGPLLELEVPLTPL